MSGSENQSGGVFMPAILRRLAPKVGAKLVFEPQYEIVGRIQFPNGRKSYFYHNKFNLNSVSSARIAQDKGHTTFFLHEQGFRVPRSEVFLNKSYRNRIGSGQETAEARLFAAELGWNVYLKPLRKSQGDGIYKSCNVSEYDEAAGLIFDRERKVQLQAAYEGRDYRMVVLDGELISAYERIKLNVCGNGASTISELLSAKQADFLKSGRDTIIQQADPRITRTLRRHGMNLDTVLSNKIDMTLLDVANLSCGGTTQMVTDRVHKTVADLVIKVSEALDLRFAGVDIIISDATASLDDYAVIEVNSAPGLDHYAGQGAEHEAQIDGLYLKVLEAVSRGPR